MGNAESNESSNAAAGTSEEDSSRRQLRENTAKAVGIATGVAAVALAGWGLTKLVSSSTSSEKDQKTNHKGKLMVATGSSRGDQIPSIEFEDSHSDSEDEEESDEEGPEYYVPEGRIIGRDKPISGKPVQYWRFPSCGKLKLNTDGAVKWRFMKDGKWRYIKPPRAGFGGVIRDKGGSLIVGFYRRFMVSRCEVLEAIDPKKKWVLEAELKGIYEGLRTIQRHDLREVELYIHLRTNW